MCRGDLHLLIDGARRDVQGAAEDEGKTEDVVDLIGIVRTSRGHDGVRANFAHLLGRNLGIGICHGEDQRLWRHLYHHVLGDRTLDRKADEDVRAVQRILEAARFGFYRIGSLPLVHALGAAAIDDTLGVAKITLLRDKPIASIRSRQAMPAEPAPLTTTLVSWIFVPSGPAH